MVTVCPAFGWALLLLELLAAELEPHADTRTIDAAAAAKAIRRRLS